MSYFDTYGPFYIGREENSIPRSQLNLWDDIEYRSPGLSGAIGCYLYCLEHRGIFKPWYVGMTLSQSGFKGECFQSHKRLIYNEVLRPRRGDPVLFLFPLITPNEYRFSKSRASSKKVINWLEITLMGFAHRKNPEISNVRDMTFLRNVEVLGLLGKRRGRPFREAQAIRSALLGSPNTGRKLG